MSKAALRKLSEGIVSAFGQADVIGILLHGSLVFNPKNRPQDIDLVVVLRRTREDDCETLRHLLARSGLTQPAVQLQLLYLEEIPTQADYFSLHTCGAFFVCHLRQAEVLYGKNVFDAVTGPADYQLQLSLLQKFQQYTFQLRSALMKRGSISEKDLLQARKRSVVVLKDLLMSDGTLIQRESEILIEAANRFVQLSEDNLNFLRGVLEEKSMPHSAVTKRGFLQSCLHIHESAYAIMRSRIEQKTKCRFFTNM